MASVEHHTNPPEDSAIESRFSRSVPAHSLGADSDAAGEHASTDAGSPALRLVEFARDLAYRTHHTGVNPHDAFNQEALLLRSYGLAQWASGEWQITRQGWLLLTDPADPAAA